MMLVGAHMSISGGLDLAFSRGEEVGCTAMQIFTKNASQWRAKPISKEAAADFRRAWQKSCIGPVVAHDAYLINLAAPDPDKWERSKEAFLDELCRCAALGIPFLVAHPGAHMGEGEEAGIERIAAALREVFQDAPSDVMVLLENTAGQGSYLGHRLEHLAEIISRVPDHPLGICFDTCHAFAAGYDLRSLEGYEATMAAIDRLIGLEHLHVFHVNDSKKGLDSRVDRHEHIGRGAIGEEGFRLLMGDERFRSIPKILETPEGTDGEWHRKNLALLRQLGEEGKS